MGDFHIFQINMHFNMRCNLKCRLCTSYSPYYKNPYFLSFERCCELIDRFFEVFTTCGSYLILGGEPLVRKDLHLILDYLHQYLPQITKVVRINTNGSILVSEQHVEASKRYGDKIHWMIDDYGSHLSVNAPQSIARLNAAGISCELRDYVVDPYCGGWVDFSDMTILRNTPEKAETLFNKCLCSPKKQERSVNLYDGEMYICGQSKHCMDLGVIPKVKPEYVNICDPNLSLQETRDEITQFMNMQTQAACQYCTGICPDSVRFPVAEQIKDTDKIYKI